MNGKLIGSLAGLALIIGAANAQDPQHPNTANTRDVTTQVKDPSALPMPNGIAAPDREKPPPDSVYSTGGSSSTSTPPDKTTMGTSPADRGPAPERGTGGSGTSGTASGSVSSTPNINPAATRHDLAKTELTGKVVRAEKNTVYVDHMGAVIPLKIEPNTKFESAGITKASDLKEGQEIRASFTVKDKTTNVATEIWLEGATSGANKPGTGIGSHRTATSPNRPATIPEDKGTHPDESKK